MIGGGLKELMRRREEYGVSKKKLAEEAHLSPRYLRRLETGEIGLTERMERQISDALDRLSPGEKLSLVIDYVRIRFKTTDFHHIIRNVLRIDESWIHIICRKSGFKGKEIFRINSGGGFGSRLVSGR